MKVTNIDFKNKTFETDNGETFPLLFDVDDSITLEEFQELVDKSENAIKCYNCKQIVDYTDNDVKDTPFVICPECKTEICILD